MNKAASLSRMVAGGLFVLQAMFCSLPTPAGTSATSTDQPPGRADSPQGSVYYVAMDGDDGNPGTFDLPWRTIQYAADTLQAGDTVYIRAGQYNERVIPQNSGSPGSYITYAAYENEEVTIHGDEVTVPDWGGLFEVSQKSYIVVSGLRVLNSQNAGILVDTASNIIIENNYTENTFSSGIGVWSSDHVTVRGNEVVLACNDGPQEDITIAGTDIFEVADNHVHQGAAGTNGGEGIDVKDGSSNGSVHGNHVHDLPRVGIYIDAWDKHTYNILVYQNMVHDIDAYGIVLASESGGLLENVRVYNNISYHNEYMGLGISSCCDDLSPTHPMLNLDIINNTFFGSGLGAWGGGITVDNPDIQDVTLRNNIVSQNLSFQIVVEPLVPMGELTVDHNLIDGFRGYEGEIRGSDYVEGDPRFMGALAGNFNLQAGSPAIDVGSPLEAPGDDMNGTTRPQDGDGSGTAEFDMGAY